MLRINIVLVSNEGVRFRTNIYVSAYRNIFLPSRVIYYQESIQLFYVQKDVKVLEQEERVSSEDLIIHSSSR